MLDGSVDSAATALRYGLRAHFVIIGTYNKLTSHVLKESVDNFINLIGF